MYTVDKSGIFAFTFYILSYTGDGLFSININNVEVLQIATRGDVHVWNYRSNTVYAILKLKAEDKLVFKKIAGSFHDVRFASWIIAENAWWFVLWNLFSLNIFMQKKTALVILELKFQRCWSKKYNKMMYRYLLICIDDKNDKCWFIQPGIMVNYLSNAENPFNIYLLKCC